MNILIPDSWLKEHLDTEARPEDIQKLMSLSGPSIERINYFKNEAVYDVEITTNRIDTMSIRGFALEAKTILNENGIKAEIKPFDTAELENTKLPKLDLELKISGNFLNRLLLVKLEIDSDCKSPDFMVQRLEAVGQRSLGAMIDITNYVMWEIGHPIHVFDYDKFLSKKLFIREAKKGEKLITLDKITYILKGGEAIFENGKGEIIDLPGIMGTINTVVTADSRNLMLCIENFDPAIIRSGSLGLGVRTQAAVLNEKHPSSELSFIAMKRAVELYRKILKARQTSQLVDIYRVKAAHKSVNLRMSKLCQYLGDEIGADKAVTILKNLGFEASVSKNNQNVINAKAPIGREDDIMIEEDLIEEIARIFGYHKIRPQIPTDHINPVKPDQSLVIEYELKNLFRGFGFTETYSYSMVSEEQIKSSGFDIADCYRIKNPLSQDAMYMRRSLLPSLIDIMSRNSKGGERKLKIFEIANIYIPDKEILPYEKPVLGVIAENFDFRKIKGVALEVFNIFNRKMPNNDIFANLPFADMTFSQKLGEFGYIGILKNEIIYQNKLAKNTAFMELYLDKFMDNNFQKTCFYQPIIKYPPVIQDLAFVTNKDFRIGLFLEEISKLDKMIYQVNFIDEFEFTKTFRFFFQNPDANLSDKEVEPIRSKIIKFALEKYGACLKQI